MKTAVPCETRWSLRHDAWLDNGLELLGQIAEHIAQQHSQVVQVVWQHDGLRLIVHSLDRFVELLDDEIRQRIEATLLYWSERTGKRVLKPFVGFNQQPPNQHPLIFQESRRRAFLTEVFASTSQRPTDKGCPLCGELMGSSGQTLTLSVYPFVTKIKSLSGIRTRWTGEGLSGFVTNLPVCARCYFLGALAWMDDALLYLCDIGGTDGDAVILLPAPPMSNLWRLQGSKFYRPKHGERRTNVRFRQRQPSEDREVQDGRFSLLLAFLERTLSEIAESGEVTDLFAEAQRRISDGWLFITIPQGRLKNIVAHNMLLDEPVMRLLVQLVERNILPYAYFIAELWLADDKGRSLWDKVPMLHETLAQAILTDDFERFAAAFIPKPRRQLRFPSAVERNVKTLVQLWRWSNMDAATLEVVKKAGRALAAIAASRNQPVLLYKLERVRSASDLLETLKEGVHRLIGLEAEEMRYISLDSLEQLTELLHQTTDARQFADLKNTLMVFAGIAYAKGVMAEARTTTGGEA